jgi:3-phosphoglycerate kinase
MQETQKSNVLLLENLALQAGEPKEAFMDMELRQELAMLASMTVVNR